MLYLLGKVIDADTNHTISPILKGPIKWKKPNLKYNASLAKMYKKTKLLAQFVSHCHTFSHRDILIHKLKKYTDVDIYGKCGPFK